MKSTPTTMNKHICTFLIAILFTPALYAANAGTNYGGLQYAFVNIDLGGIGDVDPTALVGKLGYFFNDNIAIEGRLGTGLQDDDILGVDVEINSLFGVYGVFQTSSSSETTFYGVLGYTDVEAEFSGPGGSAEGDESSFSFGFGANIKGFNIEYMSYIDEDDTEATAVSIGYVIRF
jgi:outer membrane immunogenic protein